jgi:hypothetical protein
VDSYTLREGKLEKQVRGRGERYRKRDREAGKDLQDATV